MLSICQLTHIKGLHIYCISIANANNCNTCVLDDIDESSYCPPVWDNFLCWPQTKSGEEVSLSCPVGVKGLDPKSK